MDHLLVLLLLSSEPVSVRLVGGDSRCAGTLEMKHEGEWRPVDEGESDWTLKETAAVCRELDCGSAVSVRRESSSSFRSVWRISSGCSPSGSLSECKTSFSSYDSLGVTCSDSVRLVNGTSLCSGRLEVKSDQSNQSWSSVCEAAFDQQDAEVVCRELGCGAPSVLQGALYGEGEAPMWTKEFQCGGNESSLLDCRSSGSDRNTCSPGRAVGLTCSEPVSVRLVGGDSRCAGKLELKYKGEWRPVNEGHPGWTLKEGAAVCTELDCGSAVSVWREESFSYRSMWWIHSGCFPSKPLRECATSHLSTDSLGVTCSDSVRLVNGTSLCSGRLEVKSDQSDQSWSSVCEAAFDQQDAEVVCRELDCGAPSVLQGALYGEGEAPMWTKEFQCGGDESSLLDCRSSGSDRNTCSPGRAVGLTCSEPESFRLVGGDSRCAGKLELKHKGEWRPVDEPYSDWTLKEASAVCKELNCGSAVSVRTEESFYRSVFRISSDCFHSGSFKLCVAPENSHSFLNLTCRDSVRLVNGTSLCSGRLEVKSDQSDQSWSSVCEAAFDQQDAEVVCRELGCGAPSVLQGALYGEGGAPMWTKEFQCGGNESSLLDCRSSGSDRNTCSPGRAVGLTCSEPVSVRLVGGDSRCAGTLELKHEGEWRPVDRGHFLWTLKAAAVFCTELNCGSAVSERQEESSERSVWLLRSGCIESRSLRDCATSDSSSHSMVVTCSDSVRLVNGTSLCSGRLEVKSDQSDQSDQSWSSVCEAAFDQQDAAVVCRKLGCGAPSVLQGALYGEGEAPMWTKEFQCGGDESSLLDCRSSGSDRNTCSPGRAVGLTCSEPVRLVGGDSRCAGTLELKHEGEWRRASDGDSDWTLKAAAAACTELTCGSAVSVRKENSLYKSVWWILPDCVLSGSLRECAASFSSSSILNVTCSDSVRLVNGTSLCSGRLEVKSDQSDQSWSSVCEAAFDQQDAEVVCRELGCGAPSVLQGALYGEGEAPMWTKEFQCGGNESSLLDCRSSGSDRNTCSPGRAVGLTCSEPVRLVGGDSRCAGTLELKQEGEWRPVDGGYYGWTLKEAAAVCTELNCGSAVSVRTEESSFRSVWWISSSCLQSGSALRDCAASQFSSSHLNLTCSDLLLQPNISASSSMDGVSQAQQQGLRVLLGSNFTFSCSIQPQYPGGSFQLSFTSSNSATNYTQPAVNHSAHFLFPAAEPAHQGSYSCVYHVHVLSHDFSSESRQLSLSVADPRPFIIRVVVLPLILLLANTASYFYFKASRGQKPGRQEDVELDYDDLGVPAAEEEAAQGAE